MATKASLLLGNGGGIHFKEPWLLQPYMPPATTLEIFGAGDSAELSSTTAFFTELARRGLQDTTNWTAGTYKTILNVSSGKGLVAAYVGCTAGGAETHTVEFTVDGVLTEIAVATLASGERAFLTCGYGDLIEYTTADAWLFGHDEALEADKATFSTLSQLTSKVLPWRVVNRGIPCLRFNQSLLIRAKHSVDITNATATAYSGVMYRLGL